MGETLGLCRFYKYWLGYKGACKSNKTIQRRFCFSPVLQFCVWVFLGWFGWFFIWLGFVCLGVFLKVECLVFSRVNPELLLVILFLNMAWNWLSQDCICKKKCVVLFLKRILWVCSHSEVAAYNEFFSVPLVGNRDYKVQLMSRATTRDELFHMTWFDL